LIFFLKKKRERVDRRFQMAFNHADEVNSITKQSRKESQLRLRRRGYYFSGVSASPVHKERQPTETNGSTFPLMGTQIPS
jgi:hypothetical protein